MSQQENSFTHSFTASLCLYFFFSTTVWTG